MIRGSRKGGPSEAQREIVKVLALRTIWAVILLQSVLAPYFVSKGVELHDVFMIQAVFSASLIIGEVPTGVLSDLISRRAMLIFASIMRGVGATALVVLDGFWGIATAYMFIAVANSALSGSDLALLIQRHREDIGENRTLLFYVGRQKMLIFTAATMSGLIGGFIASESLVAAGVFNMVFAWLPLPIAVTLLREREKRGKDGRTSISDRALDTFQTLMLVGRKSPQIVIFAGAAGAVSFVSAMAAYAYQSTWVSSGIGLQAMGFLFALRNFSAGGWAGVTEWLVARLGFRHVVVLSLVAGLVAFLIAPVGTLYFAALSVLMVGMIDGVAGTLMITEMNRRLEQDVLATANSLVSLMSRLMVLSVTPILMLIAKHYGPAATFFLMAIFVFCALVFVIGYFRANRTSEVPVRTKDG